MQTIVIQTDTKTSKILIGEKLHNLKNYISEEKTIIITDENINKLYGNTFPPCPVIVTKPGEGNKTMDTLSYIFKKLIEYEADRTWFVVAIGGGIVCDVAGFAASIYMRGLRFGFVSTTLLSQVDASVGGKNGINFSKYKNMVGVFNQPEFVICDTSMLNSLEHAEFRSGFAEIIKAAAIKSQELFTYLEDHFAQALENNYQVMEKIIYESVMIKSGIVESDEKEKGERKKLNFGHTFAHAIEHVSGILHGEAVSIGMIMAAKMSVELGMLSEMEFIRLRNLIKKFKLPVNTDITIKELFTAIKKDKKREGEFIHMVLLDCIGKARIEKISLKILEKTNYDLRQYN